MAFGGGMDGLAFTGTAGAVSVSMSGLPQSGGSSSRSAWSSVFWFGAVDSACVSVVACEGKSGVDPRELPMKNV